MIAKRVVLAGRVQGVGYRDWMIHAARRLGIDGWVRNRRDGTVEALVAGEAAAVEELLRRCRAGPSGARVDTIEETFASLPEEPGFIRRPSA